MNAHRIDRLGPQAGKQQHSNNNQVRFAGRFTPALETSIAYVLSEHVAMSMQHAVWLEFWRRAAAAGHQTSSVFWTGAACAAQANWSSSLLHNNVVDPPACAKAASSVSCSCAAHALLCWRRREVCVLFVFVCVWSVCVWSGVWSGLRGSALFSCLHHQQLRPESWRHEGVRK